jgi:hypothetical protein
MNLARHNRNEEFLTTQNAESAKGRDCCSCVGGEENLLENKKMTDSSTNRHEWE